MPVSINYVSTNDEKSFLRKIENRINRKTGKKIVLLYGIWILNLEVVVFPLNFRNTTIIWQFFCTKVSIFNVITSKIKWE